MAGKISLRLQTILFLLWFCNFFLLYETITLQWKNIIVELSNSLASRWRRTLCGTSGLWSWPSLSTKTGSRTFFRTAWRRGSPTLWVRLQLRLFTPWSLIQDSWLPRSFCRKQGGGGRVLHVQRHVLRLCQQPPDLRKWEEAQVRSPSVHSSHGRGWWPIESKHFTHPDTHPLLHPLANSASSCWSYAKINHFR